MSNTTRNAYVKLANSKFIFHEDSHSLEVLDAVLIWTNFEGRENNFGSKAKFCNLVLNDDIFEFLKNRGWNVKTLAVDDDSEPALHFVQIKVNMDSAYPPIVSLYSEYRGKRSKTVLTNDTIQMLDHINIASADLIVNEYVSPRFPDKASGYLKKLNVIQEKVSEFGGKYDDWDDGESAQTPDISEDDIPF